MEPWLIEPIVHMPFYDEYFPVEWYEKPWIDGFALVNSAPVTFFVRHLKEEVYKKRPQTLQELKNAIIEEIACFKYDGKSFHELCQMCIARQGHFVNITNKRLYYLYFIWLFFP